jgi:hypothetical protein
MGDNLHPSQRKPRQQRKPTFGLPADLNDSQVLRVSEWCDAAGVSLRNGRRILASGNGPKVVRLSDHRIGVTVKAHRDWLARKERTS